MMWAGLDEQTEMLIADFIELYADSHCPDEHIEDAIKKLFSVLFGPKRRVLIRCGRTIIVVERTNCRVEVKKKSVVM